MKKRILTVEQIAARDTRRSKFRALSKQIAAMSPDERAALAAKMPAIVTIEGRALSAFNSCLVMYQNPQATIVGGFRQWIKHGRAVRKGEHGACIWVPCSTRGSDAQAPGEVGQTVDSDARPGFIAGTVFDVTQTAELGAGDRPEDVIEVAPAEDEKRFEPDPAAKFQFGGFINNPVNPRKAATLADHYDQAELLTLEN